MLSLIHILSYFSLNRSFIHFHSFTTGKELTIYPKTVKMYTGISYRTSLDACVCCTVSSLMNENRICIGIGWTKWNKKVYIHSLGFGCMTTGFPTSNPNSWTQLGSKKSKPFISWCIWRSNQEKIVSKVVKSVGTVCKVWNQETVHKATIRLLSEEAGLQEARSFKLFSEQDYVNVNHQNKNSWCPSYGTYGEFYMQCFKKSLCTMFIWHTTHK